MKTVHLFTGFVFLVASICCVLATEEVDKDVVFIGKQPHQQHHDKMEHVALFNHFLDKFNKSYDTKEEYHRRLRIFRANLKKIQVLQETEQGTGIYGPTIFADMTSSEFKKHLGFKPSLARPGVSARIAQAVIPNITLPTEFDWRKHNAVTDVKNQGMCGSCWAFSTTGNIEGVYAVQKKELVSLSEQELVDCDKVDAGCNGGLMTNAFETIINKLGGGLEGEKDYPYKGSNKACTFDKTEIRAKISNYVNVSRDETDMAKFLVKNGPLAVALNANAMQFYFGGVSHPLKFLCKGGVNNLDHGVLIVGYGVHSYPLFTKTMPFWSIKNSWGGKWGEQGYYRLYRGDGSCGINDMVSSAIIE
uniref:Cysteine proteinase CG12163 n=1 Tax=Cacopsylla melanoneura TaxID=428564 RepID=A0A8D8LX28_9HEMI